MAPVSVPRASPVASRLVVLEGVVLEGARLVLRAAHAFPPRRIGHDEHAAPARSERDGPELVEIRRNLERGVGVSRPRLGERRVVEIRAIAVREMDEVLHPGGSRGALREAQRAGVDVVSYERRSLAVPPRVGAEIRRLFQNLLE